jgi:hypothetical protein
LYSVFMQFMCPFQLYCCYIGDYVGNPGMWQVLEESIAKS